MYLCKMPINVNNYVSICTILLYRTDDYYMIFWSSCLDTTIYKKIFKITTNSLINSFFIWRLISTLNSGHNQATTHELETYINWKLKFEISPLYIKIHYTKEGDLYIFQVHMLWSADDPSLGSKLAAI